MGAELELFTRALGLSEPWQVVAVEFDEAERRLELHLDFVRGSRFPCPETGEPSPVHHTAERSWRHLDFFQHRDHRLGATGALPRRQGAHGRGALGPPGLGLHAPVRGAGDGAGARDAGARDGQAARRARHPAVAGRPPLRRASPRRGGPLGAQPGRDRRDELRRGQDYVSVFADLDQRRVVYATPGRQAETVGRFAHEIRALGGDPERVSEVCQDMSEAYRLGTATFLPNAQITFDRFH